MNISSRHTRLRSYIILLLSVLLLLLLHPLPARAAFPYDETINRLAGSNRYQTAVKVSQAGWDKASVVLIARGDDYADALAGAPLAYKLDAPLLLTSPENLSACTRQEIIRLDASSAVILGSADAVSDDVAQELEDMGLQVQRVGGDNRYHTAALIAGEVAPQGASSAVIVTGLNFPDALAAASYAARAGYPVLLTRRDQLPAETAAAITDLGVSNTVIVGGTTAIGSTVSDQLPGSERITGADRYATAVELARHFDPPTGHIFIATGLNYPDALAGAVLAAKLNSTILLVLDDRVPGVVEDFVLARDVEHATVLGGESVVGSAVAQRLYNAIHGILPQPVPPPKPPSSQQTTHRVRTGNLYGLDWESNEVWLTAAPPFMPAGEYVMDRQYHFWLKSGGGLEYKGRYYYMEQIPYALLPLHRPADPQITGAFLSTRAVQIRPDSPFNNLGGSFIQAQQTWGMNALYLMAHAALESAWGTSKIAKDKNNLFGFMAYDDDPYGHAATFRSMHESILYCGAYIRRSYLSEGGRWFRAPNLEGMNYYYASDQMWAVKIARAMQNIYPYSSYSGVEKPSARGQVTASALNVRSGPGTNYGIVGSLAGGAEVNILGSFISGNTYWYKVAASAVEGWVSGPYLELLSRPEGAVFFSSWYDNNSISLNVRSGPGTGYSSVDTLSFGQKVTVEEVTADSQYVWFRVTYPGSSGERWICANYVIVDW